MYFIAGKQEESRFKSSSSRSTSSVADWVMARRLYSRTSHIIDEYTSSFRDLTLSLHDWQMSENKTWSSKHVSEKVSLESLRQPFYNFILSEGRGYLKIVVQQGGVKSFSLALSRYEGRSFKWSTFGVSDFDRNQMVEDLNESLKDVADLEASVDQVDKSTKESYRKAYIEQFCDYLDGFFTELSRDSITYVYRASWAHRYKQSYIASSKVVDRIDYVYSFSHAKEMLRRFLFEETDGDFDLTIARRRIGSTRNKSIYLRFYYKDGSLICSPIKSSKMKREHRFICDTFNNAIPSVLL